MSLWVGSKKKGLEQSPALFRDSNGFREKSEKAASRSWTHSQGQGWGRHQFLGIPGAVGFCTCLITTLLPTCRPLPSPVLEVLMSESSRVPFWASRYVAGTQPCSSEVLTNHQPVEGTRENRAMRTQQDGRGVGDLDK